MGGVNKSSNTDEALKRTLHEVRNISLYAINVRYAGNVSLNGAASTAGEGYVRSFSYQNSTDLSTETTPLMFFTREGGRSGSAPMASLRSQPIPTAVFFRAPTVTAPGAIMIHHGDRDGLGLDLTPATADEVLEGVVRLTLGEPVVSRSGILESIKMTVTMRYFTISTELRSNWLPEVTPSSAVDRSATITLNFMNNKRETLRDAFEFPMGFTFSVPARL